MIVEYLKKSKGLGQLLCLCGVHDWRIVKKSAGDRRYCKRCPERQYWDNGPLNMELDASHLDPFYDMRSIGEWVKLNNDSE